MKEKDLEKKIRSENRSAAFQLSIMSYLWTIGRVRSRRVFTHQVRSFASSFEIVQKHVLFYDYVDDVLERRDEFRKGHLRLVKAFKKRGDLEMGGAFADPVDGAACVFSSKDAAEEFVSQDPYVQNGIVTRSWIRQWSTVAFDGA